MTRTEKILFAAALLLLGGAVCMHLMQGNAGDKNWTFAAVHLLFSGKKLYVGMIDMNMPLIFWIYAVPVYISLHLGFLEDFQVLVLLGLLVIGFVIFVSVQLLRWHPAFAGDKRKQAQFILLLCFVFIFLTNIVDFMGREHIFLVLIFPYILRFTPSLSRAPLPPWLRIITGCLAGVGFCVKPHCIIVFAGLQLIYFLRERSLNILISVENIIIYALGLLYLFSVWFFTPEYFSVILPMALATYSAYNSKVGFITVFIALLTFAVTFADFRLRYTSPYRRDILYFVWICPFFLAYAFANNGWSYTYNPLISMILVTTGWVWWEHLYLKKEYEILGQPSKQFLFGARACAINFAANIALILVSYSIFLTYHCDGHQKCKMEQEVLKAVESPGGLRSFGGIAAQPSILPDLIRTSHAQWETRFFVLWMLPKFFISGPDFTRKYQWILDYVGHGFAEDLDHGKPEIMFVDASPEFYLTGKHVDLLAFFSVYPDFRKAWQHYRYVRAIDYCHAPRAPDEPATIQRIACRFDVYERIP